MLFLTPPPAQLEMRGEERQEGPVLCLRSWIVYFPARVYQFLERSSPFEQRSAWGPGVADRIFVAPMRRR
jgi:hypothetical protein